MKPNTSYIIRIASCENERSWAARKVGHILLGYHAEHHKRRKGMIFLTKHGWHPASECTVLSLSPMELWRVLVGDRIARLLSQTKQGARKC